MQSNLTLDEVNQELAEADIAISDSEFEILKTWIKYLAVQRSSGRKLTSDYGVNS
jgi:hypothetical protein